MPKPLKWHRRLVRRDNVSINFFESDEPNFIWKNKNALVDFDCIIETELPEISPSKRYETYVIEGRNGELNETFDDYEAFDLPVENITIPYERLREVKQWLTGKDKLITHNDPYKYYDAVANMSSETKFANEWGVFYSFEVTFRCQPLKKRISEQPIIFNGGQLKFHDPGDEVARPFIKLQSSGGDVVFNLNGQELRVLNTLSDVLFVDCDLGLSYQSNNQPLTKGDWLLVVPGINTLTVSSNVSNVEFLIRSMYL